MFGKKNESATTKFEKAVKTFNTRNAVTIAAHKISNVGFGVATAGGTVVAGTCYYSATTKHISRKQKKQMAQMNQTACGIAIVGAGVGTVAKVIEGIAQPLPFDQSKYLALDDDDDIEEAVDDAEATVESKIAPAPEETKEGAEQNAQ